MHIDWSAAVREGEAEAYCDPGNKRHFKALFPRSSSSTSSRDRITGTLGGDLNNRGAETAAHLATIRTLKFSATYDNFFISWRVIAGDDPPEAAAAAPLRRRRSEE